MIVCPHLGDGGVQRVVTTLANYWCSKGRSVAVATLYRDRVAYRLEPGVRWIRVDRIAGSSALRLLDAIRRPLKGVYRQAEMLLARFGRWRLRGPAKLPAILCALWTASEPLRLRLLAPLRASRSLLGRLLGRYELLLPAFLYPPLVLRVRALRSVLRSEEPSQVVALCGSSNVIAVLARKGLGCPLIISERNDPRKQRLREPWEILRRRYYASADVVTANSRGALEALAGFVDPDKLRYVPNPLHVPRLPSVPRSDALLAVGRLHRQKGYDILLEAFARLGDRLPAYRLSIVGRGALEHELRRLAQHLGVASRIDWHGQVVDPWAHYVAARIFVMPSRYEGTPNALLEAMAAGLSPVVSDASPGLLELVEDGVTGLVVPVDDSAALALAIERLAKDPSLRRSLGDRARRRVADFELPKVAAHWEALMGWRPPHGHEPGLTNPNVPQPVG